MLSTGFYTLLKREVVRYMKSPWMTIVPPLINAVLYMIIFGVAVGPRLGDVNGFGYIQFMLAGLVMMTAIINAYNNPAFSLFQARWHGNIADVLTSPMSYFEILMANVIAGMFRGILTGLLILVPAVALAGMPVASVFWTVFFLLLVCFAFSCLGVITGLWAKDWDGANNLLTFVITPLAYLGGVFYSIDMVRGIPILYQLTLLNPITYMVNGLRYGLLGVSEVDLMFGTALIVFMSLGLFAVCLRLFSTGWNLKK